MPANGRWDLIRSLKVNVVEHCVFRGQFLFDAQRNCSFYSSQVINHVNIVKVTKASKELKNKASVESQYHLDFSVKVVLVA